MAHFRFRAGASGAGLARHAALALALAALVLGAAPAPAAADGFVRVAGKGFVGADGAPFPIRSISLGNWLMQEGYMFRFARAKSPREIRGLIEALIGPEDAARFWATFRDDYVAEDDIRLIKAAGFTTIRVPLHYDLFVDREGRFEGPGYALIDRLVGWAKAVDLKVILDLHAAPGGQTGVNHDDGPGYPLMFYVPAHQRLTTALWQHIAARYRDETTILGYDLLNEPISPYHDMDYLNPKLEVVYRDIVAAIRAVDPNHIIFLEGAQWATSFAMLGPPFADNVAYSYHKFWASLERDAVQEYVNYMNRYDVPIFLGETGELTDTWNQGFRTLNERFDIGWSFWPYKYMDSTSNVVSLKMPTDWAVIQEVAARPPFHWTDGQMPPKEQAKAILWSYLDSIRLENGTVNASYLASLGLKAPETVPGAPQPAGQHVAAAAADRPAPAAPPPAETAAAPDAAPTTPQ